MYKTYRINIIEGFTVSVLLSATILLVYAAPLTFLEEVDFDYLELLGAFGLILGLGFVIKFIRWRQKETGIRSYLKIRANKKSYLLAIIFCLALSTIYLKFNIWKLNEISIHHNTITIISGILSFTLVPIIEELVYRRYLQIGWENRYGPIMPLILIPIIFGLLHTMNHFPIIAIIDGFIYAWVFYKTKDLLLSILLHALHNFIVFAAGFRATKLYFHNILELNFILITVIAIVGMTTFFLFNKMNGKSQMITRCKM